MLQESQKYIDRFEGTSHWKITTIDNLLKVLMKMDIEGSEVEVLPDLLMQGSLQYIDGLMVSVIYMSI